MAEVRSSAGTPAVAAFGGLGAPSPGTPLVVDTTNAVLYALINGAVTALASGGIRSGNGAPSNADGANGNFYFRFDGTAGTFIYHKAAGSWSAFA
jgi:hypothetical protein